MKTITPPLLLGLCILLSLSAHSQTVIYVDSVSTCTTSCGGSWATAYPDLQDAINAAAAGDSVFVANGTYFPSEDIDGTSTSGREATFHFKDSVFVYGAFQGDSSEASTYDRTWQNGELLYKTILSGDLGTVEDSSDNSYNVISMDSLNWSILNGCEVKHGYQDQNYLSNTFKGGAGIRIRFSENVVIQYCSIERNTSLEYSGGGIYALNSGVSLENCVIQYNRSTYRTSGFDFETETHSIRSVSNIYRANIGGSTLEVTGDSMLIEDDQFIDNRITSGINARGLLYTKTTGSQRINNVLIDGNIIDTSFVTSVITLQRTTESPEINISKCVIVENRSWTGQVLNFGSISGGKVRINNSVFSGNQGNDGGAINSANTNNLELINCTFYDNLANANGGAVFVHPTLSDTVTIKNCIFSSNLANFSGNDIKDSAGLSTVTYSITQSTISGTGNVAGGDPNFFNTLDLIGYDSIWMTDDDGLRIADVSDAYDAGDDVTGSPYFLTTDITGASRKQDSEVDMGAYEGRIYPCNWDTVFVDSTATGADDGSSWTNAFPTLKQAMKELRLYPEDYCGAYVVCVAEGTYTSGSQIVLLDGIDLYGGFRSGGTIRNPSTFETRINGDLGGGNYASHILRGSAIDSVVVDGFTIMNGLKDNGAGNGGAAIFLGSSYPVFRNCTIRNNETTNGYLGGAVHIRSSEANEVTLFEDCVFENNTCHDAPGGAAYLHRAYASFEDCTFEGNTARHSDGGAVYCFAENEGDAGLFFTGCTFHENTADTGNGGAIYLTNESTAQVSECTFDSNDAQFGHGGALWADNAADVDFYDCTFSFNTADSSGGAAYLSGEVFGPFLECDFVRNRTQSSSGGEGGAVFLDDGASPLFNTCLFESNHSASDGGAVFANDGNFPTFSNCAFDSNTTSGNGGALYIKGESPVQVFSSVFIENEATSNGGAFYIHDSRVEISNATIFNQSIGASGAAIYATNDANPYVNNCIIHQNRSSQGGISDADAEIYFDETSADNHFYHTLTEHFTPTGSVHNATGDPSFVSETFSGSSADLFSNASNYLRLSASSTSAINAGNNAFCQGQASLDLADQARIQKGKVDLGAYESGHGTQVTQFASSEQDKQVFQGCSSLATPEEFHASIDDFLDVLSLDPDGDNVTDAFLYAAQWLMDNDAPTHRLILEIPADTYTLGLQIDSGATHSLPTEEFEIGGTTYEVSPTEPTNPGARRLIGVHPMGLTNVMNASIIGEEGAKLVFEDSIYYGGWNSTLTAAQDLAETNNGSLTFPGAMFYLEECDCIEVRSLEVDGNFDACQLGDADNDAIGGSYDGFIVKNSTNTLLDSIYAHHFGRDGIILVDDDTFHSEDLYMADSRFDTNVRQGFSWTGGDVVRAERCSFSYSGPIQPGFSNNQGACLAIELFSSDAVTQGYFSHCRLLDSYRHCLGANSGADYWVAGDLRFDHCTFWSPEDGYFAMNIDQLRNSRFSNCTIMGGFDNCSGTGPLDLVTFDSCYISDIGLDGREVYSANGTLVNLADVEPKTNPKNAHNAYYRFSNCTFESHHLRLFYGTTFRPEQNLTILNEWECNTFNIYTDDIIAAGLPCYSNEGAALIEALSNAHVYSNIFVDKQPETTDPRVNQSCSNAVALRIYDKFNRFDGNNRFLPYAPSISRYTKMLRRDGETNNGYSSSPF